MASLAKLRLNKRFVTVVVALCAGASAAPAAAQELPGFPRSAFGRIVMADRQSAADIELEAPIGNYQNEPISIYGRNSLFHRLGRPIGRLDVATDVRVVPCTAFLVSDRYVVTNHHCVPGLARNERLGSSRIDAVALVLGYTDEGVEEGARVFSVSPTPIEADETLDYAVLEVFGSPGAEFGTIPLAASPLSGRTPLWIIGHPLGEAQKVSREGCRASDPAISAGRLRHLCDTMPGNSGSPVIDPDRRVAVALHHAGSRSKGVNYAIPMSEILARSPVLSALAREAELGRTGPREPSDAPPNPALAEALAAWASVKDSEDADLLEAFAGAYEGTFVAQAARQRLAALRERADDRKAEGERDGDGRDSARAWERLRTSGSIEEIADFVARHGAAPEASQARQRLAALERADADKQRRANTRRLEWNRLRTTGSIDDVADFVERHAGTPEASEAGQRLAALRSARADERRRARSAEAFAASHLLSAGRLIQVTEADKEFYEILPRLAQKVAADFLRLDPSGVEEAVRDAALELAPRRADLARTLQEIYARRLTQTEMELLVDVFEGRGSGGRATQEALDKYAEHTPTITALSIGASRQWSEAIEQELRDAVRSRLEDRDD